MNHTGVSASPWSMRRQIATAAVLASFVSTRSFSLFYPLFGIFEPAPFQNQIYEDYALLQVLTAILLVGILVLQKPLAKPLESKRWPLALASCSGVLGAVAVAISQPMGWAIFCILGLALMAFYPALYLPAAGCRIAQIDTRSACTIVAATFAISEIYRFVFLLVPAVGTASIFLAPLVAGSILWLLPSRACDDPAGTKRAGSPSQGQPLTDGTSVWILFASASFLCILSAIFSRLLSDPTIDSIAFDERALTFYSAIVVFASLALLTKYAPLSVDALVLLYSLCSLVFLTALLSTVFLSFQGATTHGVALLKTSQRIYEALLMTAALFAVKSSRTSPIVAFSLYGILAIAALSLLSNGIAAPLNQFVALYQSPMIIPVTSLVTIACLIVVSATLAIVFFRRSKEHQVSAKEYNARLCESAGREKGLSPREIEVMQYLYQGYSVNGIAEKMYISPSTVQGHSRSIYRKMDVHSRQELIDNVNEHFV